MLNSLIQENLWQYVIMLFIQNNDIIWFLVIGFKLLASDIILTIFVNWDLQIIPILRAGLALAEHAATLLPATKTYHLGKNFVIELSGFLL